MRTNFYNMAVKSRLRICPFYFTAKTFIFNIMKGLGLLITKEAGLVITLILIAFFSRLARQFKNKKRATLNTKPYKSLDDFDKRPIYKTLTIAIIDNTKDEDLLQVVFDNLCAKMTKDMSDEYDTVLSFNKSRQAIYIIWGLVAEVENGGFNQYYFNSTRRFAPYNTDALKLVGAYQFEKLADRANHIFVEQHAQITKNQDGTLEGFSKSYENNPLNELDNEFYALQEKENLEKLEIQYIRKNKTDFADD